MNRLFPLSIEPPMPIHTYQRFVFIAVASFSVASALAQQSKPTPRADWLPTVAAADAILTAQGRWEINGKKPTPIPNPNFHFPDSGTQVGKTRLKVGDTFNVAGSLVDGTPYTLEKTKDARATMVLFLPSHCGACHALLQLEKAWYVKYRDRGLRTVCVNAWDAKRRLMKQPSDTGFPGMSSYLAWTTPSDKIYRLMRCH